MKKALGIVIAAFALCLPATAQVAPAATGGSATVTAGGAAVAFRYQGNWSVGTLLPQSIDVIDWGTQKGNSFSAETLEVLAPGAGFNSYLAGGKIKFDISSLISKTNFSADQFQPFCRGAGGETTLAGATKPTALGGCGVSYMITPNLTWTTVETDWLYFNNAWTPGVSASILYTFNPSASPSLAVHRMLAKRARMAAAAGR